jgi:hypothetical protein
MTLIEIPSYQHEIVVRLPRVNMKETTTFTEKLTDDLDFVKRKFLIESLVNKVAIGTNKKVTVTLQPPLHSLGFLSPSLALRGRVSSPEKKKAPVQGAFLD